jgi:hypothetical protein
MYQSNFHYYLAGTFFKNDSQNGNPLGISLFIKTIESNPEDHNTWLKTGEWLTQLVKNNTEYYLFGLSCLKKAFSINPDSKKESYSYSNSLINEDIWKDLISANVETLEKFKTNINLDLIVSEYHRIFYPGNINIEGRIDLIKQLAETKDILFFEFLEYIIYHETVYEIRIAALKRISFFKNQFNLESFFKELIQSNKQENEPFLSIALYHINEGWSNELLNRDIIDNIKQPTTNSRFELDQDLCKMFDEISLSFEYRHFLSFIKNKKYERLYRAIRRSDVRVYNLQVKKVLDINEELTPFGINSLEKYIQLH